MSKSKMVPVHATEIKSYLRCKLAYFWSARKPRGLFLEPAVSRPALHFGRLIHQALQEGYDTGVPFKDAFRTLSTQAQEKLLKEAQKSGGSGGSSLFAEDIQAIKEQQTLGETMMEGYQKWAAVADRGIQFLAMETNWSNVRLGRIPLAGRFDAIVKRGDGVWILDFKTTSSMNTDWTGMDLQATTYVYAARQLYGRDVRGMIFRFLLKKEPYTYDKLILKNGTVTRRKGLANLTTHYEYALALAVATIQDLAKNPEFAVQLHLPGAPSEGLDGPGQWGGRPTLKEYASLLDGTQFDKPWYEEFNAAHLNTRRMYHDITQTLKGPSNFFWEVDEYRTTEQLSRAAKYVLHPAAKEMVSRRKGRWVGPTGLGAAFAICRNCSFRVPCKLLMDGADFREILRTDYREREVRE